MRRAEIGDRDHVAARIGEGAAEVQPLVEDRRVGRLHQGDAHLPADRHHGGVHDRHRHHVHARLLCGSSLTMRRLPKRSTLRPWSGRTRVTEAASSMTAGPSMRWPSSSSSRKKTGAEDAALEDHPAAERPGPARRPRPVPAASPSAGGDPGDHEVDDLDGAVRHAEAEAGLVQVMEGLPQLRRRFLVEAEVDGHDHLVVLAGIAHLQRIRQGDPLAVALRREVLAHLAASSATA